MKTVNIYTDGACSGNQSKKNIGGWGAILEYKNHIKEIFGGEINTTNNRMEMTALLSALKELKQTNLTIKVFSDSSYLVDCINNQWYVNWMNNDWARGKKGSSVKNVDLWKTLITCFDDHVFRFHRIKGHVDLKSQKADLLRIYSKFIEWNGSLFSYEDFLYITQMNIRADALANFGIMRAKGDLDEDVQRTNQDNISATKIALSSFANRSVE